MSQVLKRLTCASSLEKSLICKRGLSSWLHQSCLKAVEPQAHLLALNGKSGLRRRQYALHSVPFSACQSSHRTTNDIRSVESRRTMSILTDLLKRKKKDEDEEEEVPDPDEKTLQLFDDTPKGLTEEEIEAKRNVSRLRVHHRRLVHGQIPLTEATEWFHHTVRYKQRMFGRYGESSGVNPGLMWPTREELKDIIEYEKIANPFTIQEMVEKKRAQRQAEKEAVEQRIKQVEDKMAMADKFKEDLFKQQAAKEREADEAKARREKLMEEVRRHFGYTVDPREDKFQELLAKKEKEQRKNLKEARKLEKQRKMLQKLEGKSSEKTKTKKKAEEVEDDDD